MRMKVFALSLLACCAMSPAAHAVPILFGNQEGGLISSPPNLHDLDFRRDVVESTAAHCAGYNRVPYITGVVPGYGNYISFICRIAPNYDPVKAGAFRWPF